MLIRSNPPEPATPKSATPEQEAIAANENTSQDQLQELAKSSIYLARLVARNAIASSDILQDLASSADAATREGVATNPNTPVNILLKLGADFPKLLLDNPVFSLLLLENPNLVEEMPLSTLKSLVEQQVPISFLEGAEKRSNSQRVSREDQLVLDAVARNLHTPASVLERLAAGTQVNWLGGTIAKHPNTLGDTLGKLARDKQCEVRQSVAEHPNTPTDVLDWLTEDLDIYGTYPHQELGFIRRIVAQNPNTPEKTLEHLAQDQGVTMNRGRDIREAVAENPNTPLSVLEKLAHDTHECVRWAVAVHPKMTVNLLIQTKLAHNEQAAQDLWLAKQVNTPIDILEQLAYRGVLVGLAVAKNPSLPGYLIEKLYVRQGGVMYADAIARHPNASASVLKKFRRHPSTYLRHLAAKHPNAPETLKRSLL